MSEEITKQDESVTLLAVIGREYILHCQESREFRRKMEKTAFGIKIKAYLTHLKNGKV
jgi:hypothetical protein